MPRNLSEFSTEFGKRNLCFDLQIQTNSSPRDIRTARMSFRDKQNKVFVRF